MAAGTYMATVRGTAAGIGDATTTYTLTVAGAGSYSLAVLPSTLSLAPGANGTATVNLDRTNVSGAVTLSLDGPPAGITASFLPASSTTNASTMTVSVDAAVAPGSYAVTVRGAATGLADRTTQFMVNVAVPAYNVSIAPTALTIQQGNAGTATITVGRNHFAGAVSLLFENQPPGIAGTFAPGTTTGTASTFTINVAANTPVGTYNLALRATAAGMIDRVLFFPVTVTTPGSGGNAEWQFCSAGATPVFFAYQDGTNNWQRVTPSTVGTVTRFAFNLTAGRGGVAYITASTTLRIAADASDLSSHSRVTRGRALFERRAQQRNHARRSFARAGLATSYSTEVVHGTSAELTTIGADNCRDTQGTKTIRATVAGVTQPQYAALSLGGASESYFGTGNPTVTFRGVPNGTVDFAGTRSELRESPDKVVLMRNLNIPDGGSLPSVIDFAGANAFAPASARVTFTGALGEEFAMFTDLTTANGESLTFATNFTGGSNAVCS
ncbi:MAG: hypothetical protein H7066_14655 [Cytophagaceae bacterium]|nr:hypothetical protein [Gemmatimonadaceae bacterium]